jgi:hypothetical protein
MDSRKEGRERGAVLTYGAQATDRLTKETPGAAV